MCDVGMRAPDREVIYTFVALTKQDSMLHTHCASKHVNAEHKIIRLYIHEMNHVMVIMTFPQMIFNIVLILKFK